MNQLRFLAACVGSLVIAFTSWARVVRVGQPAEWQAKRTESSDGTTVEVTIGNRKHIVRFPRAGTDAAVQVKM